MTDFWFIRHAESESNIGLPSISPATINITEKGREQAKHIAEHLNQEPDLFIASPYIRTTQTGKTTFDKYPEVPVEIWPIQEYTYLPPEYYHQKTLTQRYPHSRKYFRKGEPDYIVGEGSESFNQFRLRVQETTSRLINNSTNFTILFGHGWFMRALLWDQLMSKPNKSERKHFLWKIRDKMTVSSFPYNVYSLLGLRPWKKIMYNFLLFSAFILIPNGGILKFEVKSNREIIFNDFDISHIPEVLRGSFLVDR